MLKKLLILLLIITLTSCFDNQDKRKDIVEGKIVAINENSAEWESLTKEILDDTYVNKQLGKYIVPAELSDDLQSRLLKQGIVRLSVEKYDECKKIEYTTDWTKAAVGTFYLTWTTCDSFQTQKGFYLYKFNMNFIEVWGLGNNRLIWFDNNFI